MEKINKTIIFSTFYIIGVVAFFTETVPLVSVLLLCSLLFMLFKNLISNKAAIVFYIAFAIALVNCQFQIKNFDDLSSFIPSQGKITGTVETIPTTNNPNRTKFFSKSNLQSLQRAKFQISMHAQ